MTLTKATEILQINLKQAGKRMPPDCRDALKLGIEALERLIFNRNSDQTVTFYPLPGETPE